MYLAHIQDFGGEEPLVLLPMPKNAPTSLKAVSETLRSAQHVLSAESFVEGLFRRGYAIISVDALASNLIFKGKQV